MYDKYKLMNIYHVGYDLYVQILVASPLYILYIYVYTWIFPHLQFTNHVVWAIYVLVFYSYFQMSSI